MTFIASVSRGVLGALVVSAHALITGIDWADFFLNGTVDNAQYCRQYKYNPVLFVVTKTFSQRMSTIAFLIMAVSVYFSGQQWLVRSEEIVETTRRLLADCIRLRHNEVHRASLPMEDEPAAHHRPALLPRPAAAFAPQPFPPLPRLPYHPPPVRHHAPFPLAPPAPPFGGHPDVYAQYLFAYPYGSLYDERPQRVPRPAPPPVVAVNQNPGPVQMDEETVPRGWSVERVVCGPANPVNAAASQAPISSAATTVRVTKSKVKRERRKAEAVSAAAAGVQREDSGERRLREFGEEMRRFVEDTTGVKIIRNAAAPPPAKPVKNPAPKLRRIFPAYKGAGKRQDTEKTVSGTLVINSKSPTQAYVRVPGQDKGDINICCKEDRNRALNGDEVLVEIFPRRDWKIRGEYLNALQEKLGIHDVELGEAVKKEDILRAVRAVRAPTSDYSEPSSQGTEPEATAAAAAEKTAGKTKKKAAYTAGGQSQGGKWMDIAVQLIGLQNIPPEWLQRTGKVINLIQPKGTRQAVGRIVRSKKQPKTPSVPSPEAGDAPGAAYVLEPLDARMPLIDIAAQDFPTELLLEWQRAPAGLFLGEISQWSEFQASPTGRVLKSIGEAASIASWTTHILTENSVEDVDFEPELLADFVANAPWTFTPEELAARTDLRDHCIFTIDPPDARDLDDAVSCAALGGGLFRVGVHIADVTAVLPENSALDLFARRRATSVYLVHRVVHMLPSQLINQLCSLDPGAERRCFSAVFVLTEEGEMVEYELLRGIMRSRAKLSYLQAQNVIDEPVGAVQRMAGLIPSHSWEEADTICRTILDVARITQAMRRRRFAAGALAIEQPEFRFRLDAAGMPCAMQRQEHWTSCQLIEELALLTNMVVAKRIQDDFPETALLRRHPAPFTAPLEELQRHCRLLELPMDVSSAAAIQRCLSSITAAQPQLQPVLSSLCARAMKLAEYLCPGPGGGRPDDEGHCEPADTWHYALGVAHYTHMTSPIRRYADILVHRFLSASLGTSPPPALSLEELKDIARNCNEKKLNARKCQEGSWDLFFGLFLKEHGPLREEGVVVGVHAAGLAVDVLVGRLALTQRIFVKKEASVKAVKHRVDGMKRNLLDVVWQGREGGPEGLGVWSRVGVRLFVKVDEKDPDPRNILFALEPPTFSSQSAPSHS
ncbi:DIS3-like exonuclease 2 [Paramacrobiotus metropolitanus]|uniref:DIS3-like exonuclease 2 n=1 Tax=Paramacrobiotus metropolitanus TaxID=2943436 RepID=UPI002445C8A3|nr:DIS3-like exonuclease 2 [Paramacrobiotus metropolitanus]